MEQKIIYVVLPGNRMAGLMSYFLQVLCNLYAIEGSKNKIYIKFDSNMLYKDYNRRERNVWNYYFEQPFSFTEEEVKSSKIIKDVWLKEGMGLLPLKPSSEQFNILNRLSKKYITPLSHINEKVNSFLIENGLTTKKFAAVHKRGTDHHSIDIDNIDELKNILNIKNYFSLTDKLLEQYENILLCTDEESTLRDYMARYGKKVIYYNSIKAPIGSKVGIHNSVGLKDPYKMGEDIVVETYLMSKADTILKSTSNVSTSVLVLNKEINVINIDDNFKYNL